MRLLARLIEFYRTQAELIWNWRRGRRQLVWRATVSFLVGCVALGATAALLPGLRIDSPLSLAGAVITIGALSALVRPVLLALVAPFSLLLMLLTALVFQVVVILALAPLVPGVHLAAAEDAIVAAVVFAVVNSLITWLLSLDADDSYYSMLIRRLLVRRAGVVHTQLPGMVVVQLDGVSHTVLSQQIAAGRVPVVSRWINRGRMRLSPWVTLLPSQTSASQAGIMFGNNDDIPAFRWWDKPEGHLFVSNRAADAEQLERRLSARPGLLAEDGASIGNLISGSAARSYLTMSTMQDPTKGLGRSQSYFSFFLSPYGFVHAIVLGIAEAFKELFQARRARLAGLQPRLDRHFPYPFLRAMTNVVLRPLCTSLVIEEMLRGTPVIYVTYTDYDEIAHHSGPQRAESLDALDGLDRVLGSLARAAEDAPRPYHFVILSDHGQTLGATFRQRFGHSLEDVVRQLLGGPEAVAAAVDQLEEWRVGNALLAELTRARGARTVARRALDRRARRQQAQQPASAETPDLVVCASGNLALIYFPDIEGRADLETLNARHPGMVEALAQHPGIGLLMVRSAEHGTMVVGPAGVSYLAAGRFDGEDPLAPFGKYAQRALEGIDAMSNCGDLVLISRLDVDTDQVAAFEELIGSHGGLGGRQTDALILYPADWQLDGELIGAPAVHAQLLRWLQRASAERAVADPDQLGQVAEADA